MSVLTAIWWKLVGPQKAIHKRCQNSQSYEKFNVYSYLSMIIKSPDNRPDRSITRVWKHQLFDFRNLQ